jgi:hypothetical protein
MSLAPRMRAGHMPAGCLLSCVGTHARTPDNHGEKEKRPPRRDSISCRDHKTVVRVKRSSLPMERCANGPVLPAGCPFAGLLSNAGGADVSLDTLIGP